MSKFDFDLSSLSVQPNKKLEVSPQPKIENDLIRKNKMGYQVDIPDNPIFECSFWNDSACSSKKIESEFFTNYLAEFYELDGYIENGLKKIRLNIDCISKTEDRKFPSVVRFNDKGNFSNHIKNILNDYLGEDCNNYYGRIVKTTLKTPLGHNGQMRLISVYSKDATTGKSYLGLLFIDFYHLFIPSSHNGVTAQEMQKRNYLKNKKYTKCMSSYL